MPVLNALEEKDAINQTRRATAVTLTEEGMLRASELEGRHTF